MSLWLIQSMTLVERVSIKSQKLFDLGYPGGPRIEKLAQQGDENAFKMPTYG